MRVLGVVAQIVGYAVLLAGAYYVVVAAAVGAVAWVWRRRPGGTTLTTAEGGPAAVRTICRRWQDPVPDGQGGEKLVFSCECAGVGCPFGPGGVLARPSAFLPSRPDGGTR